MISLSRSPKKSWRSRVTRSIVVQLLAAFTVLALIQFFVVKLYSVPSTSMEQTLAIGDRILVNRLPAAAPHTGDVIVFAASDLWEPQRKANSNPVVDVIRWVGDLVGIGPSLEHVLVKRVIAGPGQTVSCCDVQGRVLVDGRPLTEPYVVDDFAFVAGRNDCSTSPASARCFTTITVPAGEYFVLGDHRTDSNDSIADCRVAMPQSGCLKMVGSGDVIGRAFMIVFPISRWGVLDQPSPSTAR